jgi:DNA-directed RNA polymerase specialized sigma24 family protein
VGQRSATHRDRATRHHRSPGGKRPAVARSADGHFFGESAWPLIKIETEARIDCKNVRSPSGHAGESPERKAMSSIGSLTLCVQRLRSADTRERDDAARIIWERFSSRLQSLVRRHLDNRIRCREDEQDVLLSMYANFCADQFEGKPPPASREELWKLLVRITMCKVVNTANRHLAARRDVRRERSLGRERDADAARFPRWMLEHVDKSQPSPEEQVIVLDELHRLLHDLPDELRQIVLWKLDGYTNAEIACMIGRTVRCVELKMQLIRKRLGSSSGGRPAEDDQASASG